LDAERDRFKFICRGIFYMTRVVNNNGNVRKKSIVPQEDSQICDDDLTDLKLHAAQEILSEVFGITVIEAEDMIKQRSRERTLWPEAFKPIDNNISLQTAIIPDGNADKAHKDRY
jgi:hypothetical protein